MADACKQLGEMVLQLLHCLKTQSGNREQFVANAKEKLELVSSLAQTIRGSLQGESAETLADMLDGEMAAMDKAIEEAAKRIEVIRNMYFSLDFIEFSGCFIGYVSEFTSSRFRYKIGGERKNFGFVYDFDAGHKVIGAKIATATSGNRRSGQSKCNI